SAILWQMETAGRPLDTPERRAGLRERLRERLRRIADRTVYQDYRIEIERRMDAEFGYDRGAGRRRTGPFQGQGPWQPSAGRFPGRFAAPRSPVAWGGGEAARRGMPDPDRLQQELALATLINHPDLLVRHAEDLAHMAFPEGPLDRLRRTLVDFVAVHPERDWGRLRHRLSQRGLSAPRQALLHGTRDKRSPLPAAPTEQANEG